MKTQQQIEILEKKLLTITDDRKYAIANKIKSLKKKLTFKKHTIAWNNFLSQ
jgi:hypothetical protein